MANLPQQDTIKQYLANGVQTQFSTGFYVPLETDGLPNIDVYVTLAGATPIPETDIKIWGVDYTYTPAIDPILGGTINFLPGKVPPNLSFVTLVRDVQASLDVEFANASTFNGINLDNALDKLLLIEQQNKSYALSRNLSYIVNSYLPDSTLLAQVQIPVLGANQIWLGTGLGVTAVTLQQGSDTSTLRSELAVNAPVTNGAHLVGYYDTINLVATTVKDYLDNLTSNFASSLWQPGDMKEFGGTVVQAGWLPCNGAAVSRTTYSRLFAAIGTAWGVGDGSTTFNVPDFRRRTAVGSGGSSTGVLGNAVGNVGGEEAHVQLEAELATHSHAGSSSTAFNQNGAQLSSTGHVLNQTDVGQGSTTLALTIAPDGTSAPMNVIQPSAVVLKIIKY